jgi:hypothetical protein
LTFATDADVAKEVEVGWTTEEGMVVGVLEVFDSYYCYFARVGGLTSNEEVG